MEQLSIFLWGHVLAAESHSTGLNPTTTKMDGYGAIWANGCGVKR